MPFCRTNGRHTVTVQVAATAKYPVGLGEGVSPISLQIAACGIQPLNGVFVHNPVWGGVED